MKKIVSLILCTAMLFTGLCFNITAYTEELRTADPHTLNDWEHLFGEEVIHTGNAGAVWSDKSVLTDGSLLGVELTDDSNFAVALSALASDMNIVGYSGVPTDTMLIIESSDTDTCIRFIERAAKAIFDSNNHSRIGAVIYSSNESYVLPIAKHSADISSSLVRFNECGNLQQAMYKAYELFMDVEDTSIEGEEIQSGSKRLPVCLLMTKSSFTEASSNFADLSSADLTTQDPEYAHLVPFAMQLTAAYAKASVEKHYDHEGFVYTLGSVSELFDTESTSACWDIYEDAPLGSSVQLVCGKEWIRDNGGYWQPLYKSFKKESYSLTRDYVTEYYSSESHFDTVINEIIEHSIYDPTYVEGGDNRFGGYIEFIDDIGRHMEVKDIKGIRLAGMLYTGEALAKNFVPGGGNLGSVASSNELGNEMIWAVMERLGIDELSTAQQLVSLAYRSGQLSYNSETGEYSNYIGWYADENGSFIGHAKDSDTVYPEGAVFYNKSYGFTGALADGYRSTDMMYVSVQVHTRIATGTQAVIFRVPAALIPVITYNVSFTGDDLSSPGDITLDRDDKITVDTNGDGSLDSEVEITPIRLVYEVGLSSEIDDITVHSIVGDDYEHVKDGVYTFYTNRWDIDDLGHDHPSQAKNTVSFFSPSPENERYYYTHNTIVYELKDGEYTPYKGTLGPEYESGRFFRSHNVYEYSDKVGGGNATVHTHYEEMTADTLSKAKRSDNGSWYIPKGTVYKYFEDHEHYKTENVTGTVGYSHYVNVESVDGSSATYYVDYILGNNGRLTLKAAEGIKLSVYADKTMKGRNDMIPFEISAPDGSYRLVSYTAEGKTERTLTVSAGKATVELMLNSEIYIVGFSAGAEIDLRMLTEDKDYNGKGKESVKLTAEASSIIDASFETSLNAPSDSGMIVLGMEIEHPLGDEADPSYHEFSFDISYNGNTESITLRHAEAGVIKDIPIGAELVITENTLPAGFTSDKPDNKYTLTVDKAGIYTVDFVNTYSPNEVTLENVTLTGDIEFTGRELLADDRFTYRLQRFNGKNWADMAELTATRDKPEFDFTPFITAESFKAPGIYSYRVMPVLPSETNGIRYDKVSRWFEIKITDSDWDGSYEIDGIVGFNGGIVAKNNNRWNLHTSYFSDYSASGNDAVTIVVDTLIEGNDELPLDGYLYGLYQNGVLIQTFPRSDINGESVITLSYSVADIGNSIDYTVKQIISQDALIDMAYSDREYEITVIIEDDLMGNVKATISYDGKSAREAQLSFINKYIPAVSDKDTDKDTDNGTTVSRESTDLPSNSPLTGDMGIVFWCVLLAGSAAIIVILICTNKKRKTVN